MWCYISKQIGDTMKDLIILFKIIVFSVAVVGVVDALAIATKKNKNKGE